MPKGPFFPWLKPDHKQKQIKPPISVASYVVDQWRKMAIGGLVIGAVGVVGGLAAGAWAFQKERMPQVTVTPIIHPNGWAFETYTDRSDRPLDDRIVCSVLQNTVLHLRTVAPGKKEWMQLATDTFTGDAAARIGRELKALDWYQPILDQRRTRQVLVEHMNCFRMAGTDNAFQVKWRERLVGNLGPVPNTERDRVMLFGIVRANEIKASIASWNPWGVFITEYSGVWD